VTLETIALMAKRRGNHPFNALLANSPNIPNPSCASQRYDGKSSMEEK